MKQNDWERTCKSSSGTANTILNRGSISLLYTYLCFTNLVNSFPRTTIFLQVTRKLRNKYFGTYVFKHLPEEVRLQLRVNKLQHPVVFCFSSDVFYRKSYSQKMHLLFNFSTNIGI